MCVCVCVCVCARVRVYVCVCACVFVLCVNSYLPRLQCLLVQGYPFTCVSWGLPKGKMEQNEKDVDCAVREVR